MGAKLPGNESSMERKVARTFVPGSESAGPFRSRERNGQGAKGPGSKRARERIGQGPIGRFAPGSELARERKGLVPDVAVVPHRCRWGDLIIYRQILILLQICLQHASSL